MNTEKRKATKLLTWFILTLILIVSIGVTVFVIFGSAKDDNDWRPVLSLPTVISSIVVLVMCLVWFSTGGIPSVWLPIISDLKAIPEEIKKSKSAKNAINQDMKMSRKQRVYMRLGNVCAVLGATVILIGSVCVTVTLIGLTVWLVGTITGTRPWCYLGISLTFAGLLMTRLSLYVFLKINKKAKRQE